MPHVFETSPVEVERFYTGVISARNPLAVPIKIFGRRLIELYDAILSGANAEITVRSTLQRAAGFIQYNTNTVTGVPQKFYSFQPSSQQTIYPIVDTTTNVFSAPPGSTVLTSIVTKAQAKQTSFLGVGPYLYMGNSEFSKKWDTGTPQGVTTWGIAPTSFAASSSLYAGTGADVANVGGTVWTNPGNATGVPDAVYATSSSNGTFTDYLELTNYAFAIAAGNTIQTISANVTGHFTIASGSPTGCEMVAYLLQNGSIVGTTYTPFFLHQTTDTTINIGFYLGGSNWTPALVNNSTFGIAMFGTLAGGSGTVNIFIDSAQLVVGSAGAPTVVVNAGAGSFSATQGYQYLACYGNSADANIANPTPASVSTGVFTSKLRVEITVVASTDPQVNQIRVFRTTDTGTGAIFFELPNSPFPNTSTTVFDTAADTALQVTQAVQVGSVAFSPPPPGLVNLEWYGGRMWGSVGNLLYFSAGPDNAPMGNGNSNWPPGNVFALPTQIVSNKALNGGNGMMSITVDGIHIVQGLTNPGFTVNKWLSDVGARTQNAVDTDGSTLYIFTSDRQFISISASGIQELSQPISDRTDLLDPTLVYVAVHRSGSQDSRVFLADGSLGYFPYNLMFGAWEPKFTSGGGLGIGAVGSIEIQPGVYKFLVGSTSGGNVIQQRDLASFVDNGAAYGWGVTFGSIPLSDPTQLANVESIVVRYRNSGSAPVVAVAPNDISGGSFITVPAGPFEPPEATAGPTGFTATKYYLNAATGLWSQMSHMQLSINFPTEANQDELLSWGIFPNESTDQQTTALPQIQGR